MGNIHIENDGDEVQVWWEDFVCLGAGATKEQALRDAINELAKMIQVCVGAQGEL